MLDSVGNKENAYPVPDPKKSKINITRELSDAHKNTLKEEILYESTEKFMEKTLDVVNQNVHTALKKFQNTKDKEHEKTLKKINELRDDLNIKVKQWTLYKEI
jgi:hypothetical protein